jgi:hypothetical protein
VTSSNPFGSVTTTSADDGTTISITLDAAALTAVAAHQGGNLFIGGIDSGETSSTTAADFAVSQYSINTLSLATAPSAVPEPTSLVLLAGVIGWVVFDLKRRFRKKSAIN